MFSVLQHCVATLVFGRRHFQTQVNATTPYAYLSLEVAQSVDSYEVIKELNPVEIAEIFGNIGGFWGEPAGEFLLVLFWQTRTQMCLAHYTGVWGREINLLLVVNVRGVFARVKNLVLRKSCKTFHERERVVLWNY